MRWLEARTAVVTGVAIASLSIAGAASAFWGGAGGGSGSASSGTAEAVTLTPATSAAGLYPGGRADVSLTVSNPNAARVRIGSLSLDTRSGADGFTVDAAHAECLPDAFDFTSQTNGGAGWTVPGHDGVLPITLADAVSMSLGAANACQGATVSVYLTAGP